MGRALGLISHLLGAPSGERPVHIGKLLRWFLGSGVSENARGTGSVLEGVDFVVTVRCINCDQRKMGQVKS